MPTRIVNHGLLPVLFCSVMACSGSGLSTVTGKVTYKGDPAKGAVVALVPKSSGITDRPTGRVGDDGTFSLTTGSKSGAPPGEYDVTIFWPEAVVVRKAKPGKTKMEPDEEDIRDRLGGRYAEPGKSGLQATIKGGSNALPTFELK